MNCEFAKDNVVLYLYDELPDDVRHEFEHHTASCNVCSAELRDMRTMKSSITAQAVLEPTPNLLAACRVRLNEALETTSPTPWWRRTFDPVDWLREMKFSPALASTILILGFFGGVLTTFLTSVHPVPANGGERHDSTSAAMNASIAGIQSINSTGTDKVEIKYDRLVTDSKEGNLNDPQIQQLLQYAARNQFNSGVRMDSVKLLAERSSDERVRETLMAALRYDKNPGVRLKALQGLAPYVRQEVRVRDAMLEALSNDSNGGVRTEAIHALAPVKADTSVRLILQQLAEHDKNSYIRIESERLLVSMPEMQ